MAELTGLSGEAPVDEVVVAAHARLAKAPSMIVTATLDDALCIPERPNLPGTTSERPNWSLALTSTLEELMVDPLVVNVADALHRPGD